MFRSRCIQILKEVVSPFFKKYKILAEGKSQMVPPWVKGLTKCMPELKSLTGKNVGKMIAYEFINYFLGYDILC